MIVLQLGTPRERRDEVVESLNREYGQLIVGKTIQETYGYMVSMHTYRLLALFSFEKEPQLLRSRHRNVAVMETDVSFFNN